MIAEGIALTSSKVLEVSVGGGRPIPTRAVPGLPFGLRAVAVEIPENHQKVQPGVNAPYPEFIPLEASGRVLPQEELPNTPLSVQLASREWSRPSLPAHGVCVIDTTRVPELETWLGRVTLGLRRVRVPFAHPLLACADTKYFLGGSRLTVWVLLNAAHPGESPDALPSMKAMKGRHGLFTALGAEGEMALRREGAAWIAVGGELPLSRRLAILVRLRSHVRI